MVPLLSADDISFERVLQILKAADRDGSGEIDFAGGV